MLQASPTSLNALSYDAVVRCMRTIASAAPVPPQITTVFIDTVGDPETYRTKLVNALGSDFAEFIIEKKGRRPSLSYGLC